MGKGTYHWSPFAAALTAQNSSMAGFDSNHVLHYSLPGHTALTTDAAWQPMLSEPSSCYLAYTAGQMAVSFSNSTFACSKP